MLASISRVIFAATFATLAVRGLCAEASARPHTRIAYVSGRRIFVLDSDLGTPKLITSDDAPKHSPSWSLDGSQIAYMADTAPNLALPKLTVRNLSGALLAEQALFPGLPPGNTRGQLTPTNAGIVWWVDRGHIAVEGRLSLWACAFMVVALDTGEMTKEQIGQCGTFQPSPDGQHVLEQVPMRVGAEPDWRDYLGLDGETLYPQRSSQVRWVGEPEWSPDSRTVAVVERTVDGAGKHLVLVDLKGKARQVPLPASTGEIKRPEWIGQNVYLTDGTYHLTVDSADGTLRQAPGEHIHAARQSRRF